MKYYLIVGEASGDLHASRLMQSLKEEDTEAEFRFFGGDLMTAIGGTRVRHYKELAYMGFGPVLLHLPTILRNMSFCKSDILAWKPNVVILVDYPGFNIDHHFLERLAVKDDAGNAVVHFFGYYLDVRLGSDEAIQELALIFHAVGFAVFIIGV